MGRMAVAAVVSLWVIPISILVNKIVPDPYMDEIFHIPQAQQYCRGDFRTWDPMITTPPGLYFLSLAYLASLFPGMWLTKAARSFPKLCSVAYLRSTNGFLAVICSVLVYDLLISLRPSLSERKATVYAILMALYPVHWFFTFLYYTDVASVTAVLGMYLASRKRKYWASAMLGALAILFRQTNVVWMMFIAAIGAISYAEDFYEKDHLQQGVPYIKLKENDLLTDNNGFSTISTLRRRRTGSSTSIASLSSSEMTKTPHNAAGYSIIKWSSLAGLVEGIVDIALKLWWLKWKVLVSFAPFLMVLVAFIAFVIWNGSIVLGAKDAHVASPHFAQLLYFGLASAAALLPLHFSLGQATTLCQSLWTNKIHNSFVLLLALIIGFIMVHFFSIAHPYLLADNRHYPFYLWRKVIQVHWMMKYLFVPVYVYSWISIISILGKFQKKSWVVLFFLTCGLVLIPAPLIEFRYYTIPFYFVVLHSHFTDIKWLLIGSIYTSVNIFTMMMFLFRPFHWDHEPGTQRFIW